MKNLIIYCSNKQDKLNFSTFVSKTLELCINPELAYDYTSFNSIILFMTKNSLELITIQTQMTQI